MPADAQSVSHLNMLAMRPIFAPQPTPKRPLIKRATIDEWLDERDVDAAAVDHYTDLGHSSSDPDRERFCELIDAIETDSMRP